MALIILNKPVVLNSYTDTDLFNTIQLNKELFVDRRATPPRLRLGDGVTPGGYPASSAGIGGVATPTIVSPVSGTTGALPSVIITASQFLGVNGDYTTATHRSTFWEFASDPDMSTLVLNIPESYTDKTSIDLLEHSLELAVGTYYVRCRYIAAEGVISDWATPVAFTVASNYPTVDVSRVTTTVVGADDLTGSSVAISGDGTCMAVGTPYDDANGVLDSGSITVFNTVGANWIATEVITSPTQTAYSYFGQYLSMSRDGTVLAVSEALGDPQSGGVTIVNGGMVHVYRLSGTTFKLEYTVWSDAPVDSGLFGNALDLNADGTVLVVGERNTTGVGSVEVFTVNASGEWLTNAVLKSAVPVVGDRFGYTVAVSNAGDLIVVGTYLGATSGVFGNAYIYENVLGTWTETVLASTTPITNGQFGYSVDISSDGSTVAIGAPYEVNGTVSGGVVHLYEKNINSVWTETSVLAATEVVTGDQFGNKVLLDDTGSVLYTAANLTDTLVGGVDAGAVYVYLKDINGLWVKTDVLSSTLSGLGGKLGSDIAVSDRNDTLVCGAPRDSNNAASGGSVVVFR